MVIQTLNPDGLQSIYRQIKTDFIADFSSKLVKRDSYHGLFLRAIHFVCKATRLNQRFEILDTNHRLRNAIAKIKPSDFPIGDEAKRIAAEQSLRVELQATRESFKSAHRWFVKYLFDGIVNDNELTYSYNSITKLVREKAIGGKDQAKYDHQLTYEIFKKLLAVKEEDVVKLGLPVSCVEKMLEKAFLGLDFAARGVDWRWQEDQTPLVLFRSMARNPGTGIEREITPLAFRALLRHFQSNLPEVRCRDLKLDRCNIKGFHCPILKSFLERVLTNSGFELTLSGNDIDDAGIEAIVEGVLANPSGGFYLKVLDLSRNLKLTERATSAIAKLVAAGKVRELYLSDCPIRDSGSKAITDALLDTNCKLQNLELLNTHSGPITFISLAKAFNRENSLQILALDLKIDEKDLPIFEQILKITHLDFGKLIGCKLSNLPANPRLAAMLLQLANSKGNLSCLTFEFAERVNLDDTFIAALKTITPSSISKIFIQNGYLTRKAIASLGTTFTVETSDKMLAQEQTGVIKVQLSDGNVLKYDTRTPRT